MPTPTVYVPKRLIAPQELPNTLATLYTAPAGQDGVQLNSLILVNTSGAPRQVTIHLVESGGTPSAANLLVTAYDLPADGLPYDIMKGAIHYMNVGDTVRGFASSASGVTIHLSGAELD